MGLLAVVVATMLFSGCNASYNSVTGTVKFKDGTPLTTGRVTMTNAESESFGEIQEDGTYTMTTLTPGDGVPSGEYKVSIFAEGEAAADADAGAYGGASLVAAKYNSAETSGLTIKVDGSQTYDIEVEKP